jgi:hypothetical protein
MITVWVIMKGGVYKDLKGLHQLLTYMNFCTMQLLCLLSYELASYEGMQLVIFNLMKVLVREVSFQFWTINWTFTRAEDDG